MRRTLIVFAKAPVAGAVKTRLIPLLGAAGAAELHRRLVERTLLTAAGVAGVSVELHCMPSARDAYFVDCAQCHSVALHDQNGTDLGERMSRACAAALCTAHQVVLIGTDCASLLASDLDAAYAALDTGCDAVLGPADDGGYYLIGLRRSAPNLFTDMPWGSAAVLELTRQRLQQLGWRWHELTPRWDVDRPEDYLRLERESLLSPATGSQRAAAT